MSVGRALILQALREDEVEIAARLARSPEHTTTIAETLAQPALRALAAGGSAVETLVRALAGLGRPSSYSDLVLACWRQAPELFGLPGHERKHPDSHRVSSALYGKKGAVGRGLVRCIGEERLWQVTPLGKVI